MEGPEGGGESFFQAQSQRKGKKSISGTGLGGGEETKREAQTLAWSHFGKIDRADNVSAQL